MFEDLRKFIDKHGVLFQTKQTNYSSDYRKDFHLTLNKQTINFTLFCLWHNTSIEINGKMYDKEFLNEKIDESNKELKSHELNDALFKFLEEFQLKTEDILTPVIS